MGIITLAHVKEVAVRLANGNQSRESVTRWAEQVIEKAERGEMLVDDSAWELLTYLALVDGRLREGGYLFSDEDIHDELVKLGVDV